MSLQNDFQNHQKSEDKIECDNNPNIGRHESFCHDYYHNYMAGEGSGDGRLTLEKVQSSSS